MNHLITIGDAEIMMVKRLILFFGSIFILALFSTACVESGAENPYKSDVTITINWPQTGDTVEVGSNIIDYEVSNPYGTGLEEFYVIINDNESVEAFTAEDNSNGTQLKLNVDSVYLHKRIDVSIQAKGTNGEYYPKQTSNKQTNIYVGDDTAPPEGGNIKLSLEKFNSGNQTTFNVLLEWADTLKNVDTYELWRSEGSNAEYGKNPYKVFAGTIERYEDFTLSRFQIYYYKIRAVNKYGKSDYSNEVSTSDDPDAAPTNLIAEAIGATKIKLSWEDNAIPKIGYKVERSSYDSDGFQLIDYLPGTNTEYIDSYNLSPSNTYCYRVQSVTNTNTSEWSETACTDTWSEDVDPPQNLEAVFNQATRSVKITFKDINVDGVSGTVIERSDDNGSSFSSIALLAEGTESYSDIYDSGDPTSIEEQHSYVYRASHQVNNDAKTDYSDEANVSIPVFVPFAPSDVRLAFSNNNQFTIVWDWDDDLDISEFVVQSYDYPFGIPAISPQKYGVSILPSAAKLFSGTQPTNPVERTFVVRALRYVDGVPYYSESEVDSTNANILTEAVNNNKIIELVRNSDNININITYTAADGPTPDFYLIEKGVDYTGTNYQIISYLPYTSSSMNFEDPDGSNIGQSYRVRAVYFVAGSGTQYYSPAYTLN